MALVGNRSVLHKSPGRFLAGTVASNLRSNFNTAGSQANRSQAYSPIFCAYPSGHLSPSAWALPRKAGAISSRNYAGLTLGLAGSGAMGVNGVGTTSITFGITGTGALIVSGAGTANFTITATGNAVATLNANGTAGITFATTGAIGALANANATATITINGVLAPYAVGFMSGSTVDASVVTPSTVAAAVWQQVIEAGYTSEQILRLLAAHAAGSATGLEGADPQFVGLDGSTVRINGTYSLGTRTIDALNAE